MTGDTSDRLTIARIMGVAQGHAAGPPLSGLDHTTAVADLNQAADGRADLLALCAGVCVTLHERHPNETRHLHAAQLCLDAGGDTGQITFWIEAEHRTGIST